MVVLSATPIAVPAAAAAVPAAAAAEEAVGLLTPLLAVVS
jgi:hypothetical protein